MEHPPCYPYGGSYADLLCWHTEYWGTRQDGNTTANGKPWSDSEFKTAIFGQSLNAENHRVLLRNWRGEGPAPNSTNAGLIEKALFGDNPAYVRWRNDLEEARKRSSKGKNVRTRKFPKPPLIASPKADLPRLTPHFMGRDGERDALVHALLSPESSDAVLVQGGPGIGKTELTKAIAHHADTAARFGDRRWFVRLENEKTAEAMKTAIIRAIGCDPQYGFQAALNTLRDKPSLLILDNLETPWEPISEREKTESILEDVANTVGLKLLASSRGQSFIGGPRWRSYSLNGLSKAQSTDLFSSVSGEWVRDDPCAECFVTALGGIPLAIILVARRAYGNSHLAPLWSRWLEIGTDMAISKYYTSSKDTSLRHSIDISLQSPNINEICLKIFLIVGNFPSGINIKDVNEMLGIDGFEFIEELNNTGLTFYRDGCTIDTLPPIRDYAYRHPKQGDLDHNAIHSYFLKKLINHTSIVDDNLRSISRDDIWGGVKNIEHSIRFKIKNKLVEEVRMAIIHLPNLAIFGSMIFDIYDDAMILFKEIGCDIALAELHLSIGEVKLINWGFDDSLQHFNIARNIFSIEGEFDKVKNCEDFIEKISRTIIKSDGNIIPIESVKPLYRRKNE